jgi:hypothetical protein
MDWSTSSQLSDKTNVTFSSLEVTSFAIPLSLRQNKSSKHLKATISLVFFPKSSGISGAASINSGTNQNKTPQPPPKEQSKQPK